MMLKNKFKLGMVLLIVIVGYIFIPKIYRSHVKLNKFSLEKKSLELEDKNVKIKIVMLKKGIDEFQDDYFIEKQAREKLKMKKKGEKIYKVTD